MTNQPDGVQPGDFRNPIVPNPMAEQLGAQIDGSGPPSGARRSSGPAAWIVAVAVAGGMIFGGVAGGGTAYVLANQSAQTQVSTASEGSSEAVSSSVADRVQQSVVTVQVQTSNTAGSGSAVAVAQGGYLVTNNHVVAPEGESAARITVTTTDGRILEAEVVGADPAADLAVLKVDADLPTLEFAADVPAVGSQSTAVGSPLGLSNTVTAGIISATGRGLTIGTAGEEDESPYRFWSERGEETPQQTIAVPVLQTDAPINPGNSGGALVDEQGRLVGINVAIATAGGSAETAGSIGIGFAIEGQLVQRVVNEIISEGSATHGQLGATISDQTDPELAVAGAIVREPAPDGAAEAAGLRAGDVVTAVDGRPVTNATDLTAFVRAAPAGGEVTLDIVRDGEPDTVVVELGAL